MTLRPNVDTSDAINALQGKTPISQIWKLVNGARTINWAADTHDPIKAYIMACFAELAYLHLPTFEVPGQDRYKLFTPSAVADALRRANIRIDVVDIFRSVADAALEIIETEQFIYLIARVGPFIVVAVRGTRMKSVGDWLIDFDAAKNPARNGFYHRGFDDEVSRAIDRVAAAVGTYDRPLYFTGHSLGAAVASIMWQRWPDPRFLRQPYVFASPRFGTRAAAVRQPRYLYVRPKDYVPHVPPRLYGFSDEGAERFYLPADATRMHGLKSLAYSLVDRFKDHSMEGYRALLGQAIGQHYPERIYLEILKGLKAAP